MEVHAVTSIELFQARNLAHDFLYSYGGFFIVCGTSTISGGSARGFEGVTALEDILTV